MKRKVIWFISIVFFLSNYLNCYGSVISEIHEVSVYRTPGKPMIFFDRNKPAEKIIVRKQNNGFVIIVCINVPRENVKEYLETQADLSSEEWTSIITVIRDNNLLNWKPKLSKGRVFDYGEQGISIVGKITNEQKWQTKIINNRAVDKLFVLLSRLAKKKITSMQLFYFGL